MTKIVAAALIVAAATPALAQPAHEPPQEKSEQTAFGLSLAGTAVPLAITIAAVSTDQDELALAGAAGMLLGPSLGHWYAGRVVTGGLALRAGGTALMFVGALQALGHTLCHGHEDDCGGDGSALLIGGAAAFVGGTIYDVATAGRQARRWNEKHFDLAPMVVRGASGKAPGFGIAGTF